MRLHLKEIMNKFYLHYQCSLSNHTKNLKKTGTIHLVKKRKMSMKSYGKVKKMMILQKTKDYYSNLDTHNIMKEINL